MSTSVDSLVSFYEDTMSFITIFFTLLIILNSEEKQTETQNMRL